MASTQAILTYATPVRVDVLGAHLEVYVRSLRVVKTLRLSNRFNKTPGAAISRLPSELVTKIEHYVIEALRAEASERWTPQFRCFKQTCSSDLDMEYSSDESDDPPDTGGPCRQHAKQAKAWLAKIKAQSTGKRICLDFVRGTFVMHFGLDIWTAFVRREGNGSFGDPRQTTVAYITLPTACTTSARWSIDSREDDIDADDPDDGGLITIADQYEDGFGIPVNHLEPLSEKSLKKFARAMQVLDLKVHVDRSQKGRSLAVYESQEEKGKAEATASGGSWPRLTLLTRNAWHN